MSLTLNLGTASLLDVDTIDATRVISDNYTISNAVFEPADLSNDAVVKIRSNANVQLSLLADNDNINEDHNPMLYMSQDGAITSGALCIHRDNSIHLISGGDASNNIKIGTSGVFTTTNGVTTIDNPVGFPAIHINNLNQTTFKNQTTFQDHVITDTLATTHLTLNKKTTVTTAATDTIVMYYDAAESVFKFRKNDAGVETDHKIGGITSISSGTPGAQTGTSGLTFSSDLITDSGTIALSTTGVAANTYDWPTTVTVDATGRLTSIMSSAANTGILKAGDNLSLFANGLDTITTAQCNIVLGNLSGGSFTSATDNFLAGGSVGSSLTTGGNNVGIGRYALNTATTADHNVAIGYHAMNSTTTGSYNVGIGFRCLDELTIGVNNIALGYNINITSGYYNIILGTDAASTNATTGYYNVILGRHAGRDISSGNRNIMLGQTAGVRTTTGETNIFIGAVSGVTVTTGSHNIIIGAGDAATENTSNCIILGTVSANTGEFRLGNAAGDLITANLTTNAQHFSPTTTSVVDLGLATKRWKGIYSSTVETTTVNSTTLNATTVNAQSTHLAKTAAPTVATDNLALYYDTNGVLKYRKNNASVVTDHTIGEGTITSISSGTIGAQTGTSGLTFSSDPITSTGSIALSTTGVSAGTHIIPYELTVDTTGRLTALTASSVNAGIMVSGTNVSYFATDWSTLTTGTNNITLGANAGSALTSGNNNIILGVDAGTSLTTGMGNTILGVYAANGVTTGNYNTILGYENNTLLADTTNCIIIGSQISGSTGQLRIGNAADDLITANLTTGAQHFSPTTTAVADLGQADQQWKGVYSSTVETTTVNSTTLNTTTVNATTTHLAKTTAPTVAANNLALYYDTNGVLKYRKNDASVVTDHTIGSGSVTSISSGTPGAQTGTSGLTFSANPITTSGSIALSTTGVSAGIYDWPTSITVDSTGRIKSMLASGANTGILTSGVRNVSLFANNWDALTTGQNNITIGDSAGGAITSATNNFLGGYLAGNSLTTGGYNVALGHGVLSSATSSMFNVAIGYSVLGSATTAGYNVAIGYDINVTDGNNNIIFGKSAAAGAATTGDDNVIMGRDSANSLTTGSFNVTIGRYSGLGLTTGRYNVYVGDQTGYFNATGDDNIIIGRGDTDTTDTSSCIVLGNATAGSGELRIGNTAGDLITANLTTNAQHFSPSTNNVASLGTATKKWSNVHATTVTAPTVETSKISTGSLAIEEAALGDLVVTLKSNSHVQLSLNADADNVDETQRPMVYLTQDGLDLTGATMHIDIDNALQITSGSSTTSNALSLSAGCTYATTNGLTTATIPSSGPGVKILKSNIVQMKNGVGFVNHTDTNTHTAIDDTEVLNYYKTYTRSVSVIAGSGSGKATSVAMKFTRIGNVVHVMFPQFETPSSFTNNLTFQYYQNSTNAFDSDFIPTNEQQCLIRAYDSTAAGNAYKVGLCRIMTNGDIYFYYTSDLTANWSTNGRHVIYGNTVSYVI